MKLKRNAAGGLMAEEPGGYERQHRTSLGAGTLFCPPHEWVPTPAYSGWHVLHMMRCSRCGIPSEDLLCP